MLFVVIEGDLFDIILDIDDELAAGGRLQGLPARLLSCSFLAERRRHTAQSDFQRLDLVVFLPRRLLVGSLVGQVDFAPIGDQYSRRCDGWLDLSQPRLSPLVSSVLLLLLLLLRSGFHIALGRVFVLGARRSQASIRRGCGATQATALLGVILGFQQLPQRVLLSIGLVERGVLAA